MYPLALATTLATMAFLGPFHMEGPGLGKPPKPFDDQVSLPGKIPPTVKSVSGSWHFGYMLREATLEGGKSDLMTGTALTLREDGTYQLHYHARWNIGMQMDGRNVTEEGRFSLSGEVLLLEPTGTNFAELDNNSVVNQQTIKNETHALIVRLDKAHLTVAGRCADYQVDPVCKETPIIWYRMSAQVGTRWLGREPR
jgi:hypothetical protein